MAYVAELHINLSRNTKRLEAYEGRVYAMDAEAPPEVFRQIGPVHNNVFTYRGIFALREDAIRAVMKQADMPCTVQRTWDHYGERLLLAGPNAKHGVVGRHSGLGTYVTHDGGVL